MTFLASSLLSLSILFLAGVKPGCPPGGAGDDCDDAIAVSNGIYAGDLGANTSDAVVDCGFVNTISVWYCYTATCSGPMAVTTCLPGTEFDTTLSVFDACGGTQLACNDDTVGAPAACELDGLNRKSTAILQVVGGQTYLVRLSVWNDNFLGQGGFGSGYEIEFKCGGTCADITGPTPGVPDGNVDALDFLLLIAQWGSPCNGTCTADLTGPAGFRDDNVNVLDLNQMIAQWGTPKNCGSD